MKRPYQSGLLCQVYSYPICASVRVSRDVHCAGAETLPDRRGQGHGAVAVTAWARAVRGLGVTPFYSSSWDNLASRDLARRLGLRLFGVDFTSPEARFD